LPKFFYCAVQFKGCSDSSHLHPGSNCVPGELLFVLEPWGSGQTAGSWTSWRSNLKALPDFPTKKIQISFLKAALHKHPWVMLLLPHEYLLLSIEHLPRLCWPPPNMGEQQQAAGGRAAVWWA